MGHTYTSEEILAGLDLVPYMTPPHGTSAALQIFQGFVACRMFTALAGPEMDEEALDTYDATDVFPSALRDAWNDVSSFLSQARRGGIDFDSGAYTDDDLDSIGSELAFSVDGHGTGLWDSAWLELEQYREGIRCESWIEHEHFGPSSIDDVA